MDTHDAVIVGSGINGLVAAALLARAGWDVAVLEQADRLGGAIHTAEATRPGYRHDLYSCWHPLFVGGPAYPELSEDLARHGLEYRNTDLPAGVALTGGGTAVLSTDSDANVAEFDRLAAGDGERWREQMDRFAAQSDLAFGALGTELWSLGGARLGAKALASLKVRGSLQLGAEALEPARPWLRRTFDSEEGRALLSPWVGHNGMGPDDAGSAIINRVIAASLVQGGCPVPVGGGSRLVDALVGVVREHGGTVHTGADVVRVTVHNGRATGVETADGTRVAARRAVLASVTPQALYLRLLDGVPVPGGIRESAAAFRYGRGDMQIHLALSERPRWAQDDGRLSRAAIVHVTPGLDAVSRAVNEAERSLLPAEPTIVCGQPAALDPTRAPDGGSIIWIQLQETPYRPVGDAAGEIDVGGGEWTEDLKDRYADRVLTHLGHHVTNLDSATVGRAVLSPADLERANPNLVHGDPYAGSCQLDQFLLWRPLPQVPSHRTPVPGLLHIGASTHPGPGLSGASGLLAARTLLRPSLPVRLLHTLRR